MWGHWDMLSHSTPDVNGDSERGTRLTGPSSKNGKKHTRMPFHDGTGSAILRLNLHQRGQLLSSVWVPEVDPPAGAAEGCSGEQRAVRREVTGGQEVEGLTGSSCQVPDECVRAQTPEAHHLRKRRRNQYRGCSDCRAGQHSRVGC